MNRQCKPETERELHLSISMRDQPVVRANQVLVNDITYIPMKAYLDDFNSERGPTEPGQQALDCITPMMFTLMNRQHP